jgi:hypothetical protein
MEVSGISEAKARQIAEFVASLPAEAEERRAEPPEPIEWPVEADLLVQAVHKLTYAARAALIRVDQGVLEYELYAELCKWVKRFGIYASDPLRDIERSLNTAGDVVRLRAQLEAALTLEKMPKPLQRELAKGLARSRKLLKQLG